MKVVNDFPPNIQQIALEFPIEAFRPVFTYGDTLYNPTGGEISDDLMAHEEEHEKQQARIGIDNWWNLYLKNRAFRLTQELEAYRTQTKLLKTKYNRAYWKPRVQEMARNLSSPLYGNIIKFKDAKELING